MNVYLTMQIKIILIRLETNIKLRYYLLFIFLLFSLALVSD